MKVKHTHTFCGILMFLLFVGLLIALFSQREGLSNNPRTTWNIYDENKWHPVPGSLAGRLSVEPNRRNGGGGLLL